MKKKNFVTKRIMPLFLSAVVFASTMPMISGASEDTSTPDTIEVKTKADLVKALGGSSVAHTDGSYVKVDTDITLTKALVLKLTETCTLRLGSKNITYKGSSSKAITIEAGELVIDATTGGVKMDSVDAHQSTTISVEDEGILSVNDGSVSNDSVDSYSAVSIYKGGKAFINGGTFSSKNYAMAMVKGGAAKIKSGSFKGVYAGLYSNGTDAAPVSLDIAGGSFTSSYVPGDDDSYSSYGARFDGLTTANITGGTFNGVIKGLSLQYLDENSADAPQINISAGKFTGSEAALEILRGSVNISGGTFAGSKTGPESSSAAIQIDTQANSANTTLNITGGTFTGTYGFLNFSADANIRLSHGTFSGTVYAMMADASGNSGRTLASLLPDETYLISLTNSAGTSHVDLNAGTTVDGDDNFNGTANISPRRTITFEPKFATSGTAPASMIAADGESIIIPENTGSLKREGYAFTEWAGSGSNGKTYKFGDVLKVNGNLTLFPKWVEKSVVDEASQLETVIESLPDPITASVEEINAAIDKVISAKRQYEQLSENAQEAISQSKLQKLSDLINLIVKISLTLDADADIDSEVEVSNMDKFSGLLIDASEIVANREVSLTLKIVNNASPTSNDVALITAKATGQTIGKYWDITLKKQLEGNTKTISEIPMQLIFDIEIPEDIQGGSNYRISRVHNGESQILPTTPNGNKLTFKTDKFSTYAILYTDKAKETVGSGNGDGKGGSGSGSGSGGGTPATGDNLVPLMTVYSLIGLMALFVAYKTKKSYSL